MIYPFLPLCYVEQASMATPTKYNLNRENQSETINLKREQKITKPSNNLILIFTIR